ncbi:MAG: hypothetical protein AB1512_11775 [Thermodesulfobacteriota bacterium]
MDDKENEALSVLGRIRDSGLLLSLATAYLCEAPFLKRLGRELALNVERLRGEIDLLRKQFPGRFQKEVNTEELLARLLQHAERMQSPGPEIMTRCGQGELGRALESDIDALSAAVQAVRSQVGGTPVPYGRKEAVSSVLESGAPALSGIALRVLRVFLLLILLAALVFGYLFFTMQKEGPLVEEMKGMESKLQSQERILADLERQKTQLSRKAVALEDKLLSPAEKLEYLELGVQIRSIEEKQRDLEGDIAAREERLRSQQKMVEEIMGKSFVERLLRR